MVCFPSSVLSLCSFLTKSRRHNGFPSCPESGHLTRILLESEFTTIALPSNTPTPRRPSIVSRGSTAGLSLNTRRGSLYSHTQERPSISESPSESIRNSSHSCHRHVGEGASDDSDSSESVREDSDSEEETGLRPLSICNRMSKSLKHISLFMFLPNFSPIYPS